MWGAGFVSVLFCDNKCFVGVDGMRSNVLINCKPTLIQGCMVSLIMLLLIDPLILGPQES